MSPPLIMRTRGLSWNQLVARHQLLIVFRSFVVSGFAEQSAVVIDVLAGFVLVVGVDSGLFVVACDRRRFRN